MAASVTLPPPGPAREFYCRVSPGRPPPDTPTDRAHRKNQARRTALTPARPCSPLLAPARHCRLGCRGCRAPARPRRCATTNCTSWARTNDQNVPDPNAAPTRPRPRLDLQCARYWPLTTHLPRPRGAPPQPAYPPIAPLEAPRPPLAYRAALACHAATAPPALQPNQLCISQHTLDRDRPGAGKGSGARIQGTTPSGGRAENSGPVGRLLAPDSSPKSPTPVA